MRAGRAISGRYPLRARFLRNPSIDAATAVGIYVTLLLCVPAQLVVKPLGAVGSPANLWGLVLLLWWCAETLGGRRSRDRPSPVRRAVVGLGLAIMLSYIAGSLHGWHVPAGVHQWTDRVLFLTQPTSDEVGVAMLSAVDRGLLTFAGSCGVALVVIDGLLDRFQLERLITWLLCGGSVLAVIGIIQYFTGLNISSFFAIPGLSSNGGFGGVDSRSSLRRIQSTASHAIEFGVVASALFPLALHRVLTWPRPRRWWLPVTALGIAVPLSISRSAILVFALTSVVLMAGWPPTWRSRALFLSPFILGGMRVVLPGVLGTLISFTTNAADDPSVTGRTDDYVIAFRFVGQQPWFGRGYFSFIPDLYRIFDNQFLGTLVETGVVGLGALLLLMATAAGSALVSRQRIVHPASRHLALSLLACVLGISISFATFDLFAFPMASGIFFLLVAMCGAVANLPRRPAGSAAAAESATQGPAPDEAAAGRDTSAAAVPDAVEPAAT